ncbi:MAG: hypothetical protein AB1Z20_01560, partial [Desulfobacterales bacterium]
THQFKFISEVANQACHLAPFCPESYDLGQTILAQLSECPVSVVFAAERSRLTPSAAWESHRGSFRAV